jgi:tetratricopeptide (TPR) repeat protein
MADNDWPDFNDLWDYSDPAGTEARFRELLPAAETGRGASYHLQLLTQIGRTLGLQKKFDEGHALLDEVAAAMTGGDLVEVRYLLERGRLFNSSKRPERAMPLFERAAELGQAIGADFYIVDALHMLGIAAPAGERLAWNREAIAYAEGAAGERARGWLGSLYNNTGWALFDEERYDEALALFEKALSFREEQGKERETQIARWCVARTLRALGRPGEGLAIQRELEAAGVADGFTEEEIAECLYALGETEAARPYFRKAYELLARIDWAAEDTARMERLKSLAG